VITAVGFWAALSAVATDEGAAGVAATARVTTEARAAGAGAGAGAGARAAARSEGAAAGARRADARAAPSEAARTAWAARAQGSRAAMVLQGVWREAEKGERGREPERAFAATPTAGAARRRELHAYYLAVFEWQGWARVRVRHTERARRLNLERRAGSLRRHRKGETLDC
jgi:hypothetical protein